MNSRQGVAIGTLVLVAIGAACGASDFVGDEEGTGSPAAGGAHGGPRSGVSDTGFGAEGAERRPGAPCVDPGSGRPRWYLPAYRVIGRGADRERAAELVRALDLSRRWLRAGDALQRDGAIRYLDPQRFQRIPTRRTRPPAPDFRDEHGRETVEGNEALDFAALKGMRALSPEDAAARLIDALDQAGLSVDTDQDPACTARGITASHTLLQSVDLEGREVARAELDTRVSFREALNGLRLIGPGAKVTAAFDPAGTVTHLLYARRELDRGADVAVVPPSEAQSLCAAALGGGELLSVESELVYYAPPLSIGIERVVPHYVCRGRRSVDGQSFDVRTAIVPAIEDAPRASLSVRVSGATVSAKASVQGGRAPYTFRWASSTRSLDRSRYDASMIEYTAVGVGARSSVETLSLYAVDADGLLTTAAQSFAVGAAPTGRAHEGARNESTAATIGAEWVGLCGGLEGSAANVDGLVGTFASSGVQASFNWGDVRAWEIDFKDNAFGGQDNSFADSVDLTFYTGHANGVGFMFCSSVSDGFLRFSDAHWGESNMEWLVIAACGPLQDDRGAWRARWSGAFEGLHLLLGYATESFDDTDEGAMFARYLLDAESPLPLRQAWATTAVEIQPDDEVTWAVMGVHGPGWTMPNHDDYFWGRGPVGPDLRGAGKIGYWRISGTT